MAYPNQIYSAFSFIGFLLCAIPLYWLLEAWNVGTCLYIAWAGLGCLNFFINSVIWNSSVANVAPVWCDISTRFIVGLQVGLPAALLVINRRLFKIVSSTAVFKTTAEKRRALFVDLAIGLGIPLIQMPLQLVVEGHRFDIFEEIGCFQNTYNVPLAFSLVHTWPVVISIISTIYCALTIRLFWKSSQRIKETQGSNVNLNYTRYMRLIALSSTQLLFTLPFSLFNLYINAHVIPVQRWISWEDTHFNYSHVTQFPSSQWRADLLHSMGIEATRWTVIPCAFLFFAFFGFAEEARKHYRLAYSSIRSRLRLGNVSTKSANTFPHSSNTRFASGIRKGMAALFSFKESFLPLGSRRGPETTMEYKTSPPVSVYRLTSDDSVFEGVDAQLKAFGVVPENPAHPTPTLTTVITFPTAPHLPVPPPPAVGAADLSIPPNRLDSPLPHRPVSSYSDPSEKT
ncbi:STE3-domain-containing protein [Lactarius akahatsu]|uniref:STE3-domain-containing protein n=1 Tax=Lactarius akahatsu TaxID=416441 RepID=A0AAD4LFH5_9AGAM|nr:STE3-domain-containing protein [Lactarius akahatsu]